METLSRCQVFTGSVRWPVCSPLLALLLPTVLSPAQAQIQLRCEGTLLEARGSAERELAIGQLRFSLSLEAEQRSSDRALALLQERLASIRSVLQGLQVRELRVSSPSTWQRPAESGKPAITQASLQVSGLLDPSRLQALIRQGGALPGVRLAPVSAEADPARSGDTRRALLAAAYRQAFHRAQDVASALGLASLRPLEVQAEDDRPPYVARAPMAAKAEVPPFDPNELTPPKDSASMLVRFCAR
ncbi:MAG: SIMPL domain-containing protein [Cyanobium sp.]